MPEIRSMRPKPRSELAMVAMLLPRSTYSEANLPEGHLPVAMLLPKSAHLEARKGLLVLED